MSMGNFIVFARVQPPPMKVELIHHDSFCGCTTRFQKGLRRSVTQDAAACILGQFDLEQLYFIEKSNLFDSLIQQNRL